MLQRLVDFQHLCHAVCHFVVECVLGEPGEEGGGDSEGESVWRTFLRDSQPSGGIWELPEYSQRRVPVQGLCEALSSSCRNAVGSQTGRKTREGIIAGGFGFRSPNSPETGWRPSCLEAGSLTSSHQALLLQGTGSAREVRWRQRTRSVLPEQGRHCPTVSDSFQGQEGRQWWGTLRL